ncbi:MAG: hypothetical protein QM482_07990 [Sulfurospirillum sp.]
MKKIKIKYIVAGALLVGTLVDNANAIPSFARQTGFNCAVCHTTFPELTQVGRDFKLNGYVMGGGKNSLVSKLSAMVQLGETNTKVSQTSDKAITFEQASIFFGGKIYKNIGAFTQFTYDGADSTDSAFGIDLLDIRYANHTKVNGKNLVYGVTINNNLGVQDLWNNTGAWRYPYAGGLAIGSTLFDPDMAPPMGGIGVYGMWNDLIYTEIGAYKGSKGSGFMQFFSWNTKSWIASDPIVDKVSPYIRVAIQHNFGANYIMFGGFGFKTKINPDPTAGSTLDEYKDHALDAEWQYNNGNNLITVTASKIWETQTLNASNPGTVQTSDTTNAKISYYYNHKYGATFNYMTSKNSDTTNNATGATYEFDYLPVKKIRLSLQYNTYSKFGGTSTNASDNNNIYLNAWLMF